MNKFWTSFYLIFQFSFKLLYYNCNSWLRMRGMNEIITSNSLLMHVLVLSFIGYHELWLIGEMMNLSRKLDRTADLTRCECLGGRRPKINRTPLNFAISASWSDKVPLRNSYVKFHNCFLFLTAYNKNGRQSPCDFQICYNKSQMYIYMFSRTIQ